MVTALKWVSVEAKEVFENAYRLEAGCYNIEAIKAKTTLKNLPIELKQLYGDGGFAHAYHRLRFRRVFVKKSEYPIFQPSQITDVYPKPELYISGKTKTNIEALRVSKGQMLLTCSGTVGKCTFIWNMFNRSIFSHDLIRIKSEHDFDTAYIYAYMLTETGQTLLSAKPYGAVIKHIEPEHLINYFIPYPDESLRKEIGNKIITSYELRDKSNDLIDEAEKLLIDSLKLPPIEQIKTKQYQIKAKVNNFVVSYHNLEDRLEGSYHNPLLDAINDNLKKADCDLIPLGDKRLSTKIILPGRFKRVYVEKDKGTVFLGGKQIYELDPYNKKYLSIKKHGDRIASQLFLHENMIAITCSGTIGKVNIIPKHWENWTMSQHVVRIVPAYNDMAGYLYIWLNSEYGRALIERYAYGAVIKEIDNKQMASMEIPILKNPNIIKQINKLALEANKLRSEAYYLEQEAIDIVNNNVLT